MLQPERGQVKIAAYANSGLLTVHVVQARNFQSKWQEKCNGFLKVTLYPEDEEDSDQDSSNRCKTEIQQQNNQPQFDEKFSFELLEEDLKRRILISGWHQEEDTGHNEFLGCMSFGIQHIVSKRRVVNGWYYLLNEKLGKRKHLQVSSQKNMEYDPSVIPQINQDLAWMEPCVFVLKKEATEDLGIEVSGAFPAIVHSLHPGSPGESIGLQPGDRIVRINGFNVSRSTDESVSRILMSHETQIILEIQRPRKQIRGPLPAKSKSHHQQHHTSLDIQQALDAENYMDRASLMQAKFNSELNVHQRRQLQNSQIVNNTTDCCGQNDRHHHQNNIHHHMNESRMCCGGDGQCGNGAPPYNDPGQSMCSVNNPRLASHGGHSVSGGRQPFSQCSINNGQDGYFSEGQPMRRKQRSSMSQHLESGYISEGQQSMRRTSTRNFSFRDNGYYSEGQPMRRPSKLQALQEEESGYYNEANTIQESCCQGQHHDHHHQQQQHPGTNTSRVQTMNYINKSKRHSVGVTASMAQDGYCSEGQPRNMKRGSRQISHGLAEEGYYSEGGQGMRMRTRPNGSVCYSSNNNKGNMSVMNQQREMHMERMYHPQGMSSREVYQEGDIEEEDHHHEHHEHEETCPMHQHPNHQHKNVQLEEHLYQEENRTKRDKVSAWLSNIPHPKEMHLDPSVPNPFPELSDTVSSSQRPKPIGCTGKRGKEQGLDPIYEEPEITSISMLLDKRRQLKQLEPIQEEGGANNKENAKPPQPIKKGGGGAVSLFGLCGGIASKKKKKDKTIKL